MDSKSDDHDDMDDKNQDLGGDGGPGDGTGTKRRRRGDAGERNYTCGCGKSYLSYPALYTHIKTKHNGVTPDGTCQPQSNGKSGRGRPKVVKEDSGTKVKEEDKVEDYEGPDANSAKDTIINFLKGLGTTIKYNDEEDEGQSIISPSLDSFDLVASFPKDILKPEDYGSVIEELSIIWKTKTVATEDYDREAGLKKTNMNKVFAIFLYQIGRYVKQQFFREFVFFLMMYRRALNEIGWAIKAETMGTSISENERRMEYCAVNTGEYAPDICNDFITDKWAEYLNQYELSDFKVIRPDTESTKNAVFLTQHFCNWLHAQRYSNSRLQINEDNDI